MNELKELLCEESCITIVDADPEYFWLEHPSKDLLSEEIYIDGEYYRIKVDVLENHINQKVCGTEIMFLYNKVGVMCGALVSE